LYTSIACPSYSIIIAAANQGAEMQAITGDNIPPGHVVKPGEVDGRSVVDEGLSIIIVTEGQKRTSRE